MTANNRHIGEGQLGSAEKERFRATNRDLDAMPPEIAQFARKGGRIISDQLRRGLPDLDDVTLGRVTMVLGDLLGGLAGSRHNAEMVSMGNSFLAAGLELTAVEWDSQRP